MKKLFSTLLCSGLILTSFSACKDGSKIPAIQSLQGFNGKAELVKTQDQLKLKTTLQSFTLSKPNKKLMALKSSYNKGSYEITLNGAVNIEELNTMLEALVNPSPMKTEVTLIKNQQRIKYYTSDTTVLTTFKDSYALPSPQSPPLILPSSIDIHILTQGFIFQGVTFQKLSKLKSIIEQRSKHLSDQVVVNIKIKKEVQVDKLLELMQYLNSKNLNRINIFLRQVTINEIPPPPPKPKFPSQKGDIF